jgi:hypothetical protein
VGVTSEQQLTGRRTALQHDQVRFGDFASSLRPSPKMVLKNNNGFTSILEKFILYIQFKT